LNPEELKEYNLPFLFDRFYRVNQPRTKRNTALDYILRKV